MFVGVVALVAAFTLFFALMASAEISGPHPTDAQIKLAEQFAGLINMGFATIIGLIGGKAIP
jgi:hypothetical protein